MKKYVGSFGDPLNSIVVAKMLVYILRNPHDSYTTKLSEKFHYPLGVVATYLSVMSQIKIIKKVRIKKRVYYFVDFNGLAKMWEEEALGTISKDDTQKRSTILRITNHKQFPEFLFHYLSLHYAGREKKFTLKDLLISWFFDGLFLDVRKTKKGELAFYFDELQSLFFADNGNALKMNQALKEVNTVDIESKEKKMIEELKHILK
jgi:hypothetical protein